jgi:hypothetical protein
MAGMAEMRSGFFVCIAVRDLSRHLKYSLALGCAADRQEDSRQFQAIENHRRGKADGRRRFSYQVYDVRWALVVFVFHNFAPRSVQMPKPEKDLDTLSRLVDHALQAAVQMDETTTIYLLSMASQDVMEKIEAANRTTTAPSDDF